MNKTCLKASMLDLMSTDNMAEVIAFQKLDKSFTTEEVCRATRRVENKTILLFKFILHFIRQTLSPTVCVVEVNDNDNEYLR